MRHTKYYDDNEMLLSKTLGEIVMSTKNTVKKTTKNTVKKTTKNNTKTERQTPVDPRETARTDDYTDNQTVLNTSKNVPVDIKKTNPNETESNIVYHVGSVEFSDKTIIHKQFRVDKMPTHAVLVRYSHPKKIGATDPHHVLIYSRSEKLCAAHIRRIRKQYVKTATHTPTIDDRYTNEIELVTVRDLGMPTSEIDPKYTEDRGWERAKNAAKKLALAAKNPAVVTTAAVALNNAVLNNYLS
jgi:hypothetical protein